MDLVSVGIRTIFYDINVAEVLNDINHSKHDYFESFFNKLSISHETHFTLSELNALRDYLKQVVKASGNYKWSQFLYLLSKFGEKCLTCDNNEPIVKYQFFNRWRDLTILIGEDIFTTAFLGYKDCNNASSCNYDFSWPNIITHNDININDIMKDGVSDIHAHLGASADVFELTWLDLMHNVVNRDKDYKDLFVYNEAQLRFSDGEDNLTIPKLIQIAAYLRIHLYDNMQKEKTDGSLHSMFSIAANEDKWVREISNTQTLIDKYRAKSTTKTDYSYIDYFLRNNNPSASIFFIHSGERSFLYSFFKGFFAKDGFYLKLADFVFLYILIKTRLRREFVQTNMYHGFENFKEYQKRKDKYANIYKSLYCLYGIQSSFRIGFQDHLETRISPSKTDKAFMYKMSVPCDDFSKSFWINDKQSPSYWNISKNSLTFVTHLLKKPETYQDSNIPDKSRFGYRYIYRKQIDAIIEEAKKRKECSNINIYDIVGIDAAGNELNCPPAVFGHVYRYAREKGMTNFTYHVGEDFFDLSDGLKNINDAILFLDLREKCRLGHAIALGVNPYLYYERRGYQLIASKQKMLDVLVWIIGFCNQMKIPLADDFRKTLANKAEELYNQIGYQKSFTISDYYDSQLLRSDDIWSSDDGASLWISSRYCRNNVCNIARKNNKAAQINNSYNLNNDIIEKGKKIETFVFPSEISKVIETIQSALIELIRQKGIVIESCPTSNLKIGPIECCDELPIYTFLEKGLPVTANTDDKGIFSTSITNELSLVASTHRANSNGNYPIGIVRQLVANGEKYRFRSNANELD